MYEAPPPPLRPPAVDHVAAAHASAGPFASATLRQHDTVLRLRVRTRAPSTPARGRHALCLRVDSGRPGARMALCVSRTRGRLVLRRIVLGRRGPGARVAATVRQHGAMVTAVFTPADAGIPFGPFRWSLQRRGAIATQPRRMRSARARLLAEPRCFGAAARRCANPALRAVVTPEPEAALLIPGSPCAIFGATPVLLPCYFGVAANRARERVALLGDSHAEHWRAALEVVAQAKRWRAVSLTRAGCPLNTAEAQLAPASNTDGCVRWNHDVVEWLASHPEVQTVFVSAHDTVQFAGDPVAGYRAAWRSLPASVRRIYVLRDTPHRVSLGTVACVERLLRAHQPIASRCAEPRAVALAVDPEAEATHDPSADGRVRLLDLTDFMCTATRCPPVIGGALVLKDGDHLTRTFSTTLGPYLLRALA
jgi:SGNH domain (fused to AT3 domains)